MVAVQNKEKSVDIKAKAVMQAMKMLDAVGAQYEIVTEDGQQFGEIVRKKTVRSREPSLFMQYKEKVASLNPGESIVLECGKEQRDTIQMAAASFLSHTFGAGNYMTTRCEKGVEILILSDKRQEKAPASESDRIAPFMQRAAH